LFVLTLGYSRKAVRLLVFRSGVRIWAELQEKAFRRLGGVPRILVLDNLREGVLVPDVYDATLNPLYRDVLAHYGAVALPCRIQDPDRKGKVESAVGHAKRTPLKGQRFESLEQAQAYLDRWEANWADTRIHGTTKRQVTAMFAEEKTHPAPATCGTVLYDNCGWVESRLCSRCVCSSSGRIQMHHPFAVLVIVERVRHVRVCGGVPESDHVWPLFR
jgi:hypothetical protein